MKYDVLFAGMIRESHGRFWDLVAGLFEKEGLRIGFMPAMEEAAVPLARRGADVFCVPREIRARHRPFPSAEEIRSLESEYGLISLRNLYMHEMQSTERYDEERLVQKSADYLRTCREFFDTNEVRAVVEETGGWIECQAVYNIARKLGIPHHFVEPGPVRNTVVFAKDSMSVDFGPPRRGSELSPAELGAVREYVSGITSSPGLLVPHKDKAYYRDATFFNVINPNTFRKLIRIIHRKVFINRFEETFSTRKLAMRYLKSVARRTLLSPYYVKPDPGAGKYVYFPLHMPYDLQILVRAPQFFKQEYVVEMISRALPQGLNLLIKEHPVSIGWYPFGMMRRLAKLPNVLILHPSVSSHEVIRGAEAVITINSKVGFEALAYYKPVITLGASFYRGKGATFDACDLADLASIIIKASVDGASRDAIDGLLATVLARSKPGDLYDLSEGNVRMFHAALRSEIGGQRAESSSQNPGSI